MPTSILYTSHKFAKEQLEAKIPSNVVHISLLQVSYLPIEGKNHFTLVAEISNRTYQGNGRSVGLAVDAIVEKFSNDSTVSFRNINIPNPPRYG